MDPTKVARVLAYRRRCEEHIAREMQQQQEAQRREERQLDALHQARQGYQTCLEASQGSALSCHDMEQWRQSHAIMGQYVETQKGVLQHAVQAVAMKQGELLVARKETKMMEKLEEKALQQVRMESAQREARLMDELALMRSQYGR